MAKSTKNTESIENQVETATEAKKEDTKVTKVVDTEKEELKATVAMLQAQMEMMTKMLATNQSHTEAKRSERNIKFINLVDGTLVLKGSNIWTIEGQLNSRNFIEREARMIVTNSNPLIRSGAVYIADEEFVEENDLGEIYRYLMNDDELKGLLDKPSGEVIETYKNVPDMQKKIIIGMIVSKRLKGENVDGNVLMQIGALSGKDLISIEAEE